MAIKLITNSAWQNAAKVLVHNAGSFTELTADVPGLINVVGGPRHLSWTSSDNALKRITYINSAGGQTADTFILVGANNHSGKVVNLYSGPDPYASVNTLLTTFNPLGSTFIGPNLQDYVYEFSAISSKYCFSVEFADTTATKTVGKVIFGTALSFANPASAVYAPIWETQILGRNAYQVEYDAEWIFQNVSRTDAQTLERTYGKMTEPVFFYDSTGYVITDKLWHGIITELNIAPAFDNVHDVLIRSKRLRHY